MRWLGIVLMLLAACGQEQDKPAVSVPVPCSDPVKGCSVQLGGGTAKVFFSETPQPMKAFDVTVQAPHLKELTIEFSMAGMDMGPSGYRLARDPTGLFKGRPLLPVCMAGRSDWIMILRASGAEAAIPFQAGR